MMFCSQKSASHYFHLDESLRRSWVGGVGGFLLRLRIVGLEVLLVSIDVEVEAEYFSASLALKNDSDLTLHSADLPQ